MQNCHEVDTILISGFLKLSIFKLYGVFSRKARTFLLNQLIVIKRSSDRTKIGS